MAIIIRSLCWALTTEGIDMWHRRSRVWSQQPHPLVPMNIHAPPFSAFTLWQSESSNMSLCL